jgi:adenylyl-sulfate kinase
LVGANEGNRGERGDGFDPDVSGTRVERLNARAFCLWMTGLPGSGKSTISALLLDRLRMQGRRAYGLDGDVLRQGLNRDLGFTDADRSENIRRTAEVARLMVDAGLIVVVALISPFRSDREFARSRFGPNRFCEVFIDAPLQVCERRDPKGLYAKARRGELARMTGIDSPYEPPERPDLHLHTDTDDAGACVERILSWLRG